MQTRQEALRQRVGTFKDLGAAFRRTTDRYNSREALVKSQEAYSAADDIREQLDGTTRKRP